MSLPLSGGVRMPGDEGCGGGGDSTEAARRWSGTQLGVGVLGRHRRCSIELAQHGILRLLAESPPKNGVAKAPWIRLGNKRTTVLHECWVRALPPPRGRCPAPRSAPTNVERVFNRLRTFPRKLRPSRESPSPTSMRCTYCFRSMGQGSYRHWRRRGQDRKAAGWTDPNASHGGRLRQASRC